jgi:hypothetical protein
MCSNVILKLQFFSLNISNEFLLFSTGFSPASVKLNLSQNHFKTKNAKKIIFQYLISYVHAPTHFLHSLKKVDKFTIPKKIIQCGFEKGCFLMFLYKLSTEKSFLFYILEI